ncbi:MAG: AmmeMemoRadiSam system protein B [Caldilineaceae bacterium]
MSNSHQLLYPKLRQLDIRHHTEYGRPYLLLRDPQQITEATLLIPQPLAAVLAFFDGLHTLADMATAFQQRHHVTIPVDRIEELVTALDEAHMLDNERFATARQQALDDYRRAAFRPPTLAGRSYPSNPKALWQLLQDHLEGADHIEPLAPNWERPVGLLSPHIDYPRGGAVYAQIWKRAAQIVQEAELVILLGTDHYGSDPFTLTRQNYATPYGVLPTAQPVVDALAATIGEEAAFAGELRHRGEHSLELVAVWLHHMRAGVACEVAPVLCGGFHHFLYNGQQPATDPLTTEVIATLQQATRGRRTVVVASGDLAHVGPAFGGAALTASTRALLRAADDELIAHMFKGNAEGFFQAIRHVRDQNNVCGVAPIYLTMRTLAATEGEHIGYATCPADDYNTSVVTVGGMVFHGKTGD